jgi:protein involved in polysaccharide export with SLBB domain
MSPQCSGQQQNTPGTAASPLSGTIPSQASGQPAHIPTFVDVPTTTGSRSQRPPIPVPPEPLTEFQKFVVATTGQLLPIYGGKLFENVPSTFAPLENAPVPPDYTLGPGDEVRMRVWGKVNFNANLAVDRTGDIFLPQIGAVHVAGLSMTDAQQHLHDAIARVYRDFQIIAELGQIRSIQVYITGEARRPGVYTVSSLSTLVDALFASGGPSVQGSMRRIQLRRGAQAVTTLDLYKLLLDGDKSADAKLASGDIIFIPPVGGLFAAVGSVRRPAIYELLPGETVAAAIRSAGGVSSLASDTRASLERNVDRAARQAMEIRLDQAGLRTPLEDGDILHVLSLVSRFQKTVTLRGNLANPGRFAWHEGMHISDLIPDRDSLITRDYWWNRARLGLPAPEFQPVRNSGTLVQPSAPVDLNQQLADSGQLTPPVLDPQSGQPLQPGASANSEPAQRSQQASNSSTGSATPRASQSTIAEQEEPTEPQQFTVPRVPRNVVKQSVPDIDWSYAVIERMDPVSLKTTLIPFDLGKLVNQHDAAQDLALQGGDVVTIFSQSDIRVPIDEQTALVRLEGEFVHAGTYSVLPTDTLRSLVERAGGLTPNAYLYGSVFTRESTRVVQQRRLDESIHQMTLQMQRGNLSLAASPITSAQDLAGISAAQSSEQNLIAELRQMRATGRIVFQFKPDTTGLDAIPDIKLENGDTFTIPHVPSTVNVLGAVFNQNSFIYGHGGDVHSFLDLAGGPNSSGDRKRMFVIRANGAVVSRTTTSNFWSDEFLRLRLYPGDTVIVPEKTIKPSALRGLIDWSQIFSQFAIGAAAINVLTQ